VKSSENLDSMWRETPIERIARERRMDVIGRTMIPLCAGSVIAKAALVVALTFQQPAVYYVAELRGLIVLP
jgi:hypothetical protein